MKYKKSNYQSINTSAISLQFIIVTPKIIVKYGHILDSIDCKEYSNNKHKNKTTISVCTDDHLMLMAFGMDKQEIIAIIY